MLYICTNTAFFDVIEGIDIMTNYSETTITRKRVMYLTSILNETLPISLLTDALTDELNLVKSPVYGIIHLLFDNTLQMAIESKSEDEVAIWKQALHGVMMTPFENSPLSGQCLLNLAPYTRTIVYRYDHADISVLSKGHKHWLEAVTNYLRRENLGQVIAFSHLATVNLTDLSKLYKQLRKLQSYKYVIGFNTLTFKDDFHCDELVDINHLNYIKKLTYYMENEQYDELGILLDDLTIFIKSHHLSDANVIHLYKALISSTIRTLYQKESLYVDDIRLLNDVMNNFTTQFNDLSDINSYLSNIIHKIATHSASLPSYQPHIKKTLKIIRSTYNEDISLEAIAASLHLSSAYLSRLFKEEVHVNFKEYLTKYRLNIIKTYLQDTEKSISEIAQLTGYNNANQLTRIFKKYEGLTPRQYRQSN